MLLKHKVEQHKETDGSLNEKKYKNDALFYEYDMPNTEKHHFTHSSLEKSLKWLLINYQILLPNFLVFSCEWLGEFDIASKVT